MSLASILMGQGLEMQLHGRLAGRDLRILVDTGATHSFITEEAASPQAGKECNVFKRLHNSTFEMASRVMRIKPGSHQSHAEYWQDALPPRTICC